jgi:hypothetical protein
MKFRVIRNEKWIELRAHSALNGGPELIIQRHIKSDCMNFLAAGQFTLIEACILFQGYEWIVYL